MTLWFLGASTDASKALAERLQKTGTDVRSEPSMARVDFEHPCLNSAGLILTKETNFSGFWKKFSQRSLPPVFALSNDPQQQSSSCRTIDSRSALEDQQAVVLEACQKKSSRIQVKALLLERDSKSTTFDGQSIDLTDLEFEILWVLAEQAGRVVSSIRLLSQVWGLQHDPQSNRVAVYVKRLRGKLPEGLIQTQRGKGYRLQI